jgi:two-component system, LytTR family, response regulator
MIRDDRIRVLIVDDEPVARRGLRNKLKDAADIEIIGEAGNGRDAVETIIQKRPDLVFLDVQMPLLDGFRVLENLDPESLPPAIVFVTAFDEHAIRAFEINALDYLLKPVDPKRLQKTLQRARDQIRSARTKERDEKLFALLRDMQSLRTQKQKYLQRFVVKKAGRIFFLDTSEIEWISSEGNYVQLHSKGKTHLLRETMDGLESKLNPQEFVRIRRSTIVRVEGVKEAQALFNGEYVLILKDGTQLQSSRRFRKNLDALLKV